MTTDKLREASVLLHRAKAHIVNWWRPEGELPPAHSPELVEDIDIFLAALSVQPLPDHIHLHAGEE